jgi:tryptophan synthase alpha chain
VPIFCPGGIAGQYRHHVMPSFTFLLNTASKSAISCRAQGAAKKRSDLFITAGDPAPAMTVPLMHALVEGGADIIELGVPFSDPMADGR